MTTEQQRLDESCDRTMHWKRWGPYQSGERKSVTIGAAQAATR